MRRRRLVAAAAVAALLAVGTVAAVAIARAVSDPTAVWTIDGEAVAQSLERHGDGFTVPQACRRDHADPSRWRCPVEDDPGSGPSGAYAVRVRGDCWRATRGSRGRRLTGCFEALDFLWP